MSESAQSFALRAPIETLRLKRGTFFYLLCLASISTGYYVFWWIWKLKAYVIGWVFCLVLAVGMLLADHVRASRVLRDMLPVLIWFSYLLASALWSPDRGTTLYFWGADLVNLVAFLVAYTWALTASDWDLSGFFELQAIMILPVMLWFLLTIGQLYDPTLGAVRTGFATSCLTSLPFLIWRVRKRVTVRAAVILLLALLILLIGDSRSAILIMPVLLVGAFLFVGDGRISRAHSLAALLGLMVIFLIVAAVVPDLRDAITHSVSRLTTAGPAGTSFSISSSLYQEAALPAEARVDIARRLQLFVSLQSFLSHPIFGAGFQSTLAIMRKQVGWEVSAHGLPSTLLGETGLVGTAIFVWMIARFFVRVNYARSLTRSASRSGFYSTCKLTMLGMLLLGMFHQIDQVPSLFVLLAWGYAGPLPQSASG